MKVSRDQLIEDGYIILREVVPPDSLETYASARRKWSSGRRRSGRASVRRPIRPAATGRPRPNPAS